MPSDQENLLLDRRKFLTNSSFVLAAMAGSSAIGASRSAWGQPATPETVEVKTSYGRLRGKRTRDLVTFKGTPYAGSVSGVNRFKAPPPLAPWSGIRDAFTPGPPSFQPNPRIGEPDASEDCLVLNIWTPAADHRRRPVMFYNHGGGFVIGSGTIAGRGSLHVQTPETKVIRSPSPLMDEEGVSWFSQMLEKSIGFLCRSVRVCLDDNI